MIIDCHGHYTTEPKDLLRWRKEQVDNLTDPAKQPPKSSLKASDDEIRKSLEGAQLKLQRERGTDLTIFSPRAAGMAHHIGDATASLHWSQHCNDLGFVGCNLNPDPSGGYWTAPPLTDRYWYPLYEKMVELDVPAMVHVSSSCNPNFHATGAHYINADTTAFMQFLTADLFKDFPALRFVIPHGGGAVPYHWGRYRGLAQDMKRPPLGDLIRNNVFFDTCVYHQPGIDLLVKVVPIDNILFGSEMVGAVRGIDPTSGNYYDDTKRYIDKIPLSNADRKRVYEGNTRK